MASRARRPPQPANSDEPPLVTPEVLSAVLQPFQESWLWQTQPATPAETFKQIGRNLIEHFHGVNTSLVDQAASAIGPDLGSASSRVDTSQALPADSNGSPLAVARGETEAKDGFSSNAENWRLRLLQERSTALEPSEDESRMLQSLDAKPTPSSRYDVNPADGVVSTFDQALIALRQSDERRDGLLKEFGILAHDGSALPIAYEIMRLQPPPQKPAMSKPKTQQTHSARPNEAGDVNMGGMDDLLPDHDERARMILRDEGREVPADPRRRLTMRTYDSSENPSTGAIGESATIMSPGNSAKSPTNINEVFAKAISGSREGQAGTDWRSLSRR